MLSQKWERDQDRRGGTIILINITEMHPNSLTDDSFYLT